MILYITALDPKCVLREFSCSPESLDAGFDLLNDLVKESYSLCRAVLIENDQRTNLPLEAFDGLPFSAALEALRQEWQSILGAPQPAVPLFSEEVVLLTCKRLHQYEASMRTYQRMIDHCERWRQQTRGITSSEATQHALISHYESLADIYQTRLDKAYQQHQRLRNRLNQMLA